MAKTKRTHCDVSECAGGAPIVKGLCVKHHRRLEKYGDVTVTSRPPRDLSPEERLRWRGWDVTESGCWESRGFKDKDGYTFLSVGGKRKRSHRFAYEIWNGVIPEGMMVLHSCDNPPCVNPAHLSVGTHEDNMQERQDRDRSGSILNQQKVREIRHLRATTNLTIQQIADRYNIGHPCAVAVIYRRSWKHVV